MTITSVRNIDKKVDLPSVNKNVDLPSVNKTKNVWQKFKNIIKYNISHTPSEVGVVVSIFSHTPEEAMSGGLVKACVPSKNQFYSREIEFLNDDLCPTTVLNLTNLGPCKMFLMHPVILVYYPVTGQMHLLYKLQSYKCSQY